MQRKDCMQSYRLARRRREVIISDRSTEVSGNVLVAKLRQKSQLVREEISKYKLVSESRPFQNRVWLRASSKILTKTTSHIRYCRKQLHSLHVTVANNYIHYTLSQTITFITRYCRKNYIHYTLLSQKLHSLHATVPNNYIHCRKLLHSLHVTVANYYIHYTLLSQKINSLHVTVAKITFITRYCSKNYIHYTLLQQQLHSLHVTVAKITFITRYCSNNYIHYTLLSKQLRSLQLLSQKLH